MSDTGTAARRLTPSGSNAARTHGWVFIHAARRPFFAHLESELGALFGSPARLQWSQQSAVPGSWRTEFPWAGPSGTAAALMSRLRMFPHLYAEATEHAVGESPGMRFALTPDLGLWSAAMSASGDVMVNESALRTALGGAHDAMVARIEELLGEPWDAALEPLRASGERTSAPLLRVV